MFTKTISISVSKLKLENYVQALIIVITVSMCLSIYQWGQEIEMQPLIADISVVDVVKVIDVLEQHDIHTKATLDSRMLWVEAQKRTQARAALATVGINIELPKKNPETGRAIANSNVEDDYLPVYQQPWFMQMVRIIMAALVVCQFIIFVIRPALKALISNIRGTKVQSAQAPESPSFDFRTIEIPYHRIKIIAATLALTLVICFGIVSWIQQPQMQPLINDLRTVDAVQVADLFNQNRIHYYADPQAHMMYVEAQDNDRARLVLTKIGVVIDYPRVDLEVGEVASEFKTKQIKVTPLFLQPVFDKIMRLFVGALMLITLILVIAMPLLKVLVYSNIQPPEK